MNKFNTIQKNFRIKKINKLFKNFREMNVKQNAETLNFDKFTKFIRTRNVILNTRAISQYYNSIGFSNKLNGQKLLSSYLLVFFSNDLLGEEKHRSGDDNNMINWSEKLIDIFENTNITEYNYFQNLGYFLMNYEKVMNVWLEHDKNKSINAIIKSYYNRRQHIDIISKDEKLDNLQQKVMIGELKKQCKDLMKSIKMISSDFNVEFFEQNYEKIHDDMEKSNKIMVEKLSLNMRKAFMDKITNDINKGDMKSLYLNLIEIGERFITICPEKYKKSFSKKFEMDYIVDIVSDGEWNNKIINFIEFLVDTLIIFDSLDNEKDNLIIKENIKALMLGDFSKNIVEIIMIINERIDSIYQTLKKLSE